MIRAAWYLGLLFVVVPGVLAAQGSVTARGASLYESYSFKPGLPFSGVNELTVPLGVDLRVGRIGSLALSGGFARVRLTSADTVSLPHQTLSGALDTEARFTVDAIPGRLVLLATGVVPTGPRTVAENQLAVLAAISSDVIGFSAPGLGSGGNLGGGFIGALPMGRLALGFGATYKQSLRYQPVATTQHTLQPGAEFRLRGGIEGSLTRRTFFRFASILATSSRDRFGDTVRNGVGTRFIAYLSVNHGFGPASVTVYGFDVYRGSPQIEPSPTGAARLPKGNLIAGGLRVDYAVAPRTTLSPRFEYRASAAATDSATVALQRLGMSFRFGLDVRQAIRRGMAAVLQAGGVAGNVRQGIDEIPFSGLRVALSLEYTP